MDEEKIKKVKTTCLLEKFTCFLCSKLFTNATTIPECMHTFCRICIEKKLSDENQNHCPKCNVYLGVSPLQRTRCDNNIQNMRDTVFPSKGKEVQSPQLVTKNKLKPQPSLKLKTKSASKIVKKAVRIGNKKQQKLRITPKEPKVAASKLSGVADVKKNEVSAILSAREAKVAARKKFISTELVPISQPDKVTVHEKKDGKRPLLETFTETPKIRFKNPSKPETSEKIVLKSVSRNNASESRKEKGGNWESFDLLVNTAYKVGSLNNSTVQEYGVIPTLVDSSENDSNVPKAEVKKRVYRQIESVGDQNESSSVPPKSSSLKLRIRSREISQEKRTKFSEDLNLPSKTEIESKKDFGPIWFNLVASKNQQVGAPLPQISSPYLRVPDGKLPVIYIKKYLVKKLGLASEAEVEILLGGRPVSCSMNLQNLVELWLQTMPKNEKVETSVGSSAKDFVMVLSYSRKA